MSNEMILRRFIVDDWGISPAVNEAALYFAERGLLYGISIIPHSRFADYKLKEILATNVGVGCHLNLTFQTAPGEVKNVTPWIFVSRKILSSISLALFPIGRRKILKEAMAQAEWVKQLCQRLDYLDGHHHIHLYPGMLGVTKQVCAYFKIQFRVITDSSFKSNFILGTWAKESSRKDEFFECLYLGDRDLQDDRVLLKKIENPQGLPVAIHPAIENDFIENKVQDHLAEGRVYQFTRLKDVLKI